MDEKKVEKILNRGVANVIPNKEKLAEVLRSEKTLNVYFGIDPTAPKIHLGHGVVLLKLQKFAEAGHNVTLLIGDFTALVGDTSDKESERPLLTPEQIEQNFQTYKEQASKILDFSKIKVVHNSDWLKDLTYADILKLKKHFSLNDFISRELIKNRLSEGKNVGLLETEYPIMQGYDSYHLDTDLQIGGADQTFNMQAGRTLQKNLRNKESFILSTDYLTGTDGRKMSKSWGNAIWLDDSPTEMFGKIMSIKDNLILEYFTLATRVPNDKLDEVKKRLESGENPMNLKKELGLEIVTELYSAEEAETAQKHFESTVQNKELPEDIQEYHVKNGEQDILNILVNSGMLESKSKAKQILEQGGIEVDGVKLDQSFSVLDVKDGLVIKIGKHKFLKLVLSS